MTEWNNNPAPPGPQAKSTPTWAVVLIVVGVVLLLLCAVGVVGAQLQGKEKSITPIQRPGSVAPSTSASAPAGTPAAAAGPATKIDEGTYEVGPEVTPGKYKSAGAKPSAFQLCSWSVKGGDGKLIDLGTANGEAEQQLVTLKAGQVFESSGCHPWVKVG